MALFCELLGFSHRLLATSFLRCEDGEIKYFLVLDRDRSVCIFSKPNYKSNPCTVRYYKLGVLLVSLYVSFIGKRRQGERRRQTVW